MSLSAVGDARSPEVPQWVQGWGGVLTGFSVAATVDIGALMVAVFLWVPIGMTPLMLILGFMVLTFPLSIVVATSSSAFRRIATGVAAGTCLATALFVTWIVVVIVELSVNGPA